MNLPKKKNVRPARPNPIRLDQADDGGEALRNRLRGVFNTSGLTRDAFGKRIGKTQSWVSKVINGNQKSITLGELEGWARAGSPPADPKWLRYGNHLRESAREASNERPSVHSADSPYMQEYLADSVRVALLEKIKAGLAGEGWSFESMQKGQGATNTAFNRSIVVNRPKIELRYLPGKWAARYHPDLLAFVLQSKRGDANDDNKIRIASDFVDIGSVDIQQTSYFQSLVTDQIAWSCIRSKEITHGEGFSPDKILWDGTSAFVGEDGKLKRLKDTAISNQLGTSTVAFSSDGYLMFVYQNEKNRQSEYMWAPSGSGSMDWEDIQNSKAVDLLTLVEHGAKRELIEECALDNNGGERVAIPCKLMPIAFTRLVHRAGKPEFFCLGWIDATAEELRHRTPERYVNQVKTLRASADWQQGSPSIEISRVCNFHLNDFLDLKKGVPLSYALEHGLNLLVDACEHTETATVIDRFIREAAGI